MHQREDRNQKVIVRAKRAIVHPMALKKFEVPVGTMTRLNRIIVEGMAEPFQPDPGDTLPKELADRFARLMNAYLGLGGKLHYRLWLERTSNKAKMRFHDAARLAFFDESGDEVTLVEKPDEADLQRIFETEVSKSYDAGQCATSERTYVGTRDLTGSFSA